MVSSDDDQSVASLNRLDAGKLSYTEMTIDPSGGIMSRESKMEARQKLGYCTTCPQRPVLLFTFKRNQWNPLWKAKEPRSVPGECEKGVCFRCSDPRGNYVPTARIAPATTRSHLTASSRQPSGSTLGSSTHEFYHGRSGDSVRVASQHPPPPLETPPCVRTPRGSSGGGGNSPPRRHSFREEGPSVRPMSNEDVLAMSTYHSSAFSGSLVTNGSSSQYSNPTRTGHSILPRLPRTDRVAALPRSHETAMHHHPNTIDEHYQTSSELCAANNNLTIPALISPVKRIMSLRQMSSSNFSVASSLSHDFSVPSLGDESMTDLSFTAATTTTTTAAAAAAAAAASTEQGHGGQEEEEKIKDQVRSLMRDLQADPMVVVDVLKNAMKENEDKQGVQLFCIESIQMKPDIVAKTGLYRGVLKSMKAHGQNLKIQHACLAHLLTWAEADDLRVDLIHHGLCNQLAFLLTSHVGDTAIVQDVMALLRLLTIEEEGRVGCQRGNVAPTVVQAMECHPMHARIQTDGCAVLSNLAINPKLKSVNIVAPEILDAVVATLLRHINALSSRGNTDVEVVKSACFTIKNFNYREENLRALASRGDMERALETWIQLKPRASKDAISILEKMQISRVQDESLQAQVLESLQFLWNKSVPEAMDEIIQVWKEYSWSARVLITSIHQLQDMLQNQDHFADANQLDRIITASQALMEHTDQKVVHAVTLLRASLAGEE